MQPAPSTHPWRILCYTPNELTAQFRTEADCEAAPFVALVWLQEDDSMKRWLPAVLLASVFMVILYALFLVVSENLQVAPMAGDAAAGRLHHHTKNTTRFGGSPEQVCRKVLRPVFLDRQPPEIPRAGCPDEARVWLQVREPFSHQVLLPGGDSDSALVWALPGLYWAVHAGAR